MTDSSKGAKNYGSSSVSKTESLGSTPNAPAIKYNKKCKPYAHVFMTKFQIYFSLYWVDGKNYWINWIYGEKIRVRWPFINAVERAW